MAGMDLPPIGPRRQAVLDLLLEGKSPREAAAELGMSTQRVYVHVQALREGGYLTDWDKERSA